MNKIDWKDKNAVLQKLNNYIKSNNDTLVGSGSNQEWRHILDYCNKFNYDINSCTHVIKLKPRPNGTYVKELVYTKTVNGMKLNAQRDFLRELIHIRFPNTVKLLIDANGAGAGLPSMFYEPWEYVDPKTGEITEYPPIVSDDEKDITLLENALPLIRNVHGLNGFINLYYPYMKSCFEDMSLELLIPSAELDSLYKSGGISHEEFFQHMEHDILQSELSNM